MQLQSQSVNTSHGEITFWDGGRADRPTVLLIHGNSSSKRIFERQFESDLAQRYRLIAPDLPGHGDSCDAPNPQDTYFIAGYGAAMLEFLEKAGIKQAYLVGWSLGGHIALELLARWEAAESAFIFGTPPIPNDPERAMSAFLPSEHIGLTFQASFTDEEAAQFAAMNFVDPGSVAPWMIDDVKRTDERFRPLSLQGAMKGRNLDEEEIVGTSEKLLAILHGDQDAYISLDFLKSVSYRNLWCGEIQVLPAASHTPQWKEASNFNAVLARFLAEASS